MGERTLNFGADATDADFQIRDSDPAGGDLIIEHLPTGATFEYDATENAWVPTDPIGTANRKVPGVVSESVNTEDLDIGGSDFVSDGDVVPIAHFGAQNGQSVSTTSDTYENADDIAYTRLSFDNYASDWDFVAYVTAFVLTGTDETAAIRLQDPDAGQTIVEVTTDASGSINSGWQTFTSQSGASRRFRAQIKSEPGNDTTLFDQASFVIGVQL